MNDVADEFEAFRARSYSGGFSPARRNRLKGLSDDIPEVGRCGTVSVVPGNHWHHNRQLISTSSDHAPVSDTEVSADRSSGPHQEPVAVDYCPYKHDADLPSPDASAYHYSSCDYLHEALSTLPYSSTRVPVHHTSHHAPSTPHTKRPSVEMQLMDVYFGRGAAGWGVCRPREDLSESVSGSRRPLNASAVPSFWNDDHNMRPRVSSMPSRSLGRYSNNVGSGTSSRSQVREGSGTGGSGALLPFHNLRKVRSFVIVGNRLVRETDAYVTVCTEENSGLVECGGIPKPVSSNDIRKLSTGAGMTHRDSMRRSKSEHERCKGGGLLSPPLPPPSLVEKYRVMLIGRSGVGKSAIVRQFLKFERVTDRNGGRYFGGCFSSTCDARKDNYFCDGESGSSFDGQMTDGVNMASIVLDGEEATIEFIDGLSCTSSTDLDTTDASDVQLPSAYVVVYSVEDRKSFETAIDSLYELRQNEAGRQSEACRQKKATGRQNFVIILVANKVDLVRSRVVLEQEGRSTAIMYNCKYIEVSATIDHQIDELFIGILKQIRLHNSRTLDLTETSMTRSRTSSIALGGKLWRNVDVDSEAGDRRQGSDSCCLRAARDNVLARLLRGERRGSKSCVNLYVL